MADVTDPTVVFRIPWLTRLLTVLPALILPVIWACLELFASRPRGAGRLPVLLDVLPVVLAALAIAGLVAMWWTRTTATPDALYVRGLRRRRIGWDEIAAISPGIARSNEVVVVRLRDGGRVRLPAPVGDLWFGSHDRFVDRIALLIERWETYRGQAGGGTAT